MKDREAIEREVRRLHLHTKRLISGGLLGAYRSIFRGQGMEFLDVREYEPGDDVRSIDWKVTARTGDPFIKRHQEERELTVILAVDISGSSRFGSGRLDKRGLAAGAAALVALTALRNQDRVGLALFSDQLELWLRPGKGDSHTGRLLREMVTFEPASVRTCIDAALGEIESHLKERCVIFLFSDFLDDGYQRRLKILARRHDVVAGIVQDIREKELPDLGRAFFRDAETGETIRLDTGSAALRQNLSGAFAKRQSDLRRDLWRLGVEVIPFRTDEAPFPALQRFFDRRMRRRL